MRLFEGITLVVTVLCLSQSAWAVDGVIEINQARALAGGVTATDSPGFPVTIDAPGSYRLTGNLGNCGGEQCIHITASDVTIDLNGFTVSAGNTVIEAEGGTFRSSVVNGVVTSDSVPYVTAMQLRDKARMDRVDVAGGVILGSDCFLTNSSVRWGNVDVDLRCLVSDNEIPGPADGTGLTVGSGSRVLNNAVRYFSGEGISVEGGGCVVRGNTVWQTSGDGIAANDCVIENNYLRAALSFGIVGHGSMIKGNVVNEGGTAIRGDKAMVIDNVANDNFGLALEADTSTGYKGNQFDNNNSGNANPQVSGGTEIGTNICGGDTICP